MKMNRWKKIVALALVTGAVFTGITAPLSAKAATRTTVLNGVFKDSKTNQWHLYVNGKIDGQPIPSVKVKMAGGRLQTVM